MTTYDQIWETFLGNCKVSDIDLPQTPEKIYEEIRNAVLRFNNRMRKQVVCDDVTETLNEGLSDDNLLILAHYIRLLFLTNQKTYFESLWQPFGTDVGIRNFNTQIKSLESSIEKQEETIESLIINTMEDFL